MSGDGVHGWRGSAPREGRGFLLLALLLVVPAGGIAAQTDSLNGGRTTRAGVFTAVQAEQGEMVYALSCVSCHTPASHTGPPFVAAWQGKTVADLFAYIRDNMPKSEPGSLSRREYMSVLAYLLRMNGMPAGREELVPDPEQLKSIRIELTSPPDSIQPR